MELLERSTYLDTLAGYADEARNGNGRLVLVSGESGIGKTALVEAFQAQLHGARWLWGACDGLLTPRPLGPVFDIAGQSGGSLLELCRNDGTRDQLFAAFLAELDSLTTVTVAVIEDVHWADEATLDLLRFVGRRLTRMRALLLVTYRDEEGMTDSLRMLIGDLATQRATRRISLPPLSDGAVRALVGQHDVDAAELCRVTGGNPFLICEAIDAGWPAIPATVRDVVAARLARASGPARAAVQTAAVIGATVDVDLLASLLDASASLLDDCLRTGLLTAGERSLRFRHELVRMAVQEGIDPHRRSDLHARLLVALQKDGNADPAVLAHHAERAGDTAATRRYAEAAAHRSAALGAHREAAAQYERALRYTDASDRHALAELHEALATEYVLLDWLLEGETSLRAALRLQRELGNDVRVGQDLSMLSDVLCFQCRGAESDRAAEESLAVLKSLPPGPELAGAHLAVAGGMSAAGLYADAMDNVGHALEIAERLGREDIACMALTTKGWILANSGQAGISSLEEALQLALNNNAEQQVCAAYENLQDVCVSLQRLDEAQEYFTAGMAIGERRELRQATRCMQGGHADTLLLLGRWDEAAEISATLLALPEVSKWNLLYPSRVLATIRGRRGEPGHIELLDRAEEMAVGLKSVPWLTQVRAMRAELLWLSGRPDLACQEAQEAYDQALGRTDLWKLGSVAIWLSRLGAGVDVPAALPEPYALEIAGDWPGAAAAWERLGRTYDAALIRVVNSTDDAELRETLALLDDLGARATATVARRRMKELGLSSIPRGPRAATRAAPAGLTAREQEVLALLSQGLPDKEIARRLVISERTVHHHVSSILAKTGAPTRVAAARESDRLGVSRSR